MSEAIRILETLGKSAGTPADILPALLADAQLDQPERDALVDGDASTLAQLLGARVKMVSIQYPGDGAPVPDEAPQRDEEQDEPERKEEEE